jgi:RNA polymerase sigma factor (sigma-70 family)
MTPAGSITVLISRLREADPDAALRVWQRYYRRLVQHARLHLGRHPRRVSDEEDVAVSAFTSFCRAVEQGRFPVLDNRDHLWQVLLVVTERKAATHVEHFTRQKRDVRRDLDEAALAGSGSYPGLDGVPDPEPEPAFALEVADLLRDLLQHLPDDEYRQIARLSLEGRSTAEIAAELRLTPRTIQRKLNLIQDAWRKRTQP